MVLFTDTANSVNSDDVVRPSLAGVLRRMTRMGQQVGEDTGALKFLLSVTSALLVAMIVGAFTMTYFVTSHLASLESTVTALSTNLSYRLDRDERQIDRLDNQRRNGP